MTEEETVPPVNVIPPDQEDPQDEDPHVDVSDEQHLVDQDAERSGQVQVHVYKKRWYILMVFSLLGVYQGMVWNSFGPITASVLAIFCPDWDAATLALLGNWGNIMYILPVIPVLWYFEENGLRKSMILTAGLMAAGTFLRCLPFKLTAFTWMCHICAILNGVAGIIIFSAPSAVSATWFPPEERTTATGIALVLNNLGNAVSFLAAPAIVPDPAINKTSTDNHANMGDEIGTPWPSRGFGIDADNVTNTSCPDIDPDVKEHINHRLDALMYLEFGLIATCFLAIVVYFPNKPKRPPSISSSQERMDFIPGLKNICRNPNALLTALCFSLFNGLIASWYSVMNITFNHLPIGPVEDKDKIIGYIGIWAIVGNSVAAILVSRVVDSLRGKMKATLVILMVAGTACWIWLGLICLEVIPFSLLQLYLSTIMASGLTYASGPIFFEFTVELVYPVPEGIVGGFLTCIYNTVGMIFLLLFYLPALAQNSYWVPWAFMGSTCASVPLFLLVKEQYNRSVVDQFQEPRTSPSDHNSYPAIE